MSRGRRNFIEPIKKALGPERAIVFMEIVNLLDLNPDDPELVLAAVVASFIVSLTEFREWIEALVKRVEAMFSNFLGLIELKIGEALTRGADEFQTELRLSAREIAQSEYRAAAALRSQAIADEVAALAAAARDLARREAELKAQQTARGTMPAQPSRWLSPGLFGLLAAAFVLGWLAALFVLRPGPQHAYAPLGTSLSVASSSIRSVSFGCPSSRTV